MLAGKDKRGLEDVSSDPRRFFVWGIAGSEPDGYRSPVVVPRRMFLVVFLGFFVFARFVIRFAWLVVGAMVRIVRRLLPRVGRPVAVTGRYRAGMCRIYGTRGHCERSGQQPCAECYATEFHGCSF